MKEKDELEELLNKDFKPKLIEKLLRSQKVDSIIASLTQLYNRIYDYIFQKLNLKSDIQEGKILTILIATLIIIILGISAIIVFNSLYGLSLFITLIKFALFPLKILYFILKKKGLVIKKYLNNFSPKKDNKTIDNVSLFENLMTKQVATLAKEIAESDIALKEQENLFKKLKEILLKLPVNDKSFSDDYRNFNYKKEIVSELAEIEFFLKQRKEENLRDINFQIQKDLINDEIDNLNYQKKLGKYPKKLK